MTLAPRSLFGRNLLLIGLLLIVAEFGSALLVRQLVLRPRLDQAAEGLARNVAAVRGGLAALPAEQRAAFVAAFNRHSGGSTQALAQAPAAQPALTALERRFIRLVSQRAGAAGTDLIWRQQAGGSLVLRLTLDGTVYWIALPGALPARGFTGSWMLASAGAALLALVGAFAIQRRLNRPLARVVDASAELVRGGMPTPLDEDGPLETAALARSFNRLTASLAQAERERALMLAGVSHDLRTPLAKLRLGVEILADRSEPELTASMHRSVEEMDAIVGQFLDFARGDGGEAATEGDVDALAVALAQASADHGRPVELQLGAPPRVRLRAAALRRCVANLIENAFRHGRAPVTVRTGADAGSVWIEVADDGSGIAADELETLKQPFRRAHAARSGAPGSGLGLAIVDRLVRAQGGRFELRANVPRGLQARIVLPR